ncbi:GNAT family N-acetyltransferase [Zafaria cholistanensis]|nr:GNAT family N-acetyltransferase [Zafaria cholistanensis]
MSSAPDCTVRSATTGSATTGSAMTGPATIRRATADDIPATLAMKLAAWRETYADQRPAAFFARAEAAREQEIDWWRRGLEAGAELWIALDDAGRVLGCAGVGTAREDDADARVGRELQMLYVLAGAHGTGLGGRLMDAALGAHPALVWVLERNPRAHAFFRKHGFVPDGRIEALADDWAGLREVRLVRRIAAPAVRRAPAQPGDTAQPGSTAQTGEAQPGDTAQPGSGRG